MFRTVELEDIKFILGKPLKKGLDELVEISMKNMYSILPWFNQRIWWMNRETYVSNGKLIVFIPTIIYSNAKLYYNYLVYPSLEFTNDITNKTYTFAIRLLDESDDPNPILSVINDVWKDELEVSR